MEKKKIKLTPILIVASLLFGIASPLIGIAEARYASTVTPIFTGSGFDYQTKGFTIAAESDGAEHCPPSRRRSLCHIK